MSKTYTRTVYQVIFSTKYRRPTLWKPGRPLLFGYLGRLLQAKSCRVYGIGGTDDHIHLVFGLHPNLSIAQLVKDLKLAGSSLLKKHPELFPAFDYWQNGYAALTYTPSAIPNLVRYVQRQESHHDSESSREELRRLLTEHGIDIDERYFA